MRHALASMCALIIFVSLSSASAFEVGSKSVEVSLTHTFVSRYIWRGQDLLPQNDSANQPEIDIRAVDCIWDIDATLNVWASYATSLGHETAEEMDFTFYFSQELFESAFTLEEGFTYFDFPNLNDQSDVIEPWMSVTVNKIPYCPFDSSFTVFAGYDFEAERGGPDEGWYFSWAITTEFSVPENCPLTQEGQRVTLGVVNWGNDGVANLKPSVLYATEVTAQTSYVVGTFEINPSVNYTVNHTDEINSGDEELWFGLALSCTF